MSERISSIPKKCMSYFLALTYKNERKLDYEKFVKTKLKDYSSLYDFLRGRYSGRVSRDVFISDYLPTDGNSHDIYIKVKSELLGVENEALKISGVKYVSGKGWNHYVIGENSSEYDERSSNKFYLTLDYDTFKSIAFLSILRTLVENEFQGQIKLYQPENVSSFFLQDDNIVVHTKDVNNLNLARRICLSVLKENGIRVGGSSFSDLTNEAKDVVLPELKMLDVKSMKTSFSNGMAMLASEFLLLAVKKNLDVINDYDELRKLIQDLFKKDGSFYKYINEHYS